MIYIICTPFSHFECTVVIWKKSESSDNTKCSQYLGQGYSCHGYQIPVIVLDMTFPPFCSYTHHTPNMEVMWSQILIIFLNLPHTIPMTW